MRVSTWTLGPVAHATLSASAYGAVCVHPSPAGLGVRKTTMGLIANLRPGASFAFPLRAKRGRRVF